MQWRGARSAPSERRRAFGLARTKWPEVRLSYEQFERHLASIGIGEGIPADVVGVYLCAACATQQPLAIRALEREYFKDLRGSVARVVRDAGGVDDVMQDVRTRLLIGSSPAIATYRGRGSLGAWLRTIGVNAAVDYERSRQAMLRRQRAFAREVHTVVSGAAGCPEQAALESQCSGTCERALIAALGSLDPEERKLLYHRFVTGLNIDMLGQLYSIDRSTAARRVSRCVRRVREKAHAGLLAHFSGTPKELGDLLACLCEHLDSDAIRLPESDSRALQSEALPGSDWNIGRAGSFSRGDGEPGHRGGA
jgi:RNA polymerase sigma-70 factor (ECF subfamily)